ncbi:HD-GYP domain-containing protein [Hippea maritima]|uniref:Metal dependent phosphohydrolase n=1 Tax=Hippea maritima (strain ATCC 700847 / DSM 10411 / MH2) TaxID=760142 RepID=F2LVB0_HIPMA|nr:HD domain-containing phosphohydrolase [Hippea maritima]AEA33694.1 metal dependent phosphohydrolase [Hippea maritima DSM 10411]
MYRLSVDSLKPGMVLGRAIISDNGTVLLNRGVKLTQFYIDQLKKLGYDTVFIEDPDTTDIVVEDDVKEQTRRKAIQHIRALFSVPISEMKGLKKTTVSEIKREIEKGRIKEKLVNSRLTKNIAAMSYQIVDEVLDNKILSGLVSFKRHSDFTFKHCVDVTVLSVAIADKFLYDRSKLTELAKGALLHDIGRLLINKSLYEEPRRLTKEEFELIKTHPTLGYITLKDIADIGIIAAHIVYQHHEQQNGQGYPRGLKGDNTMPLPKKEIKKGYIMPLAEIVYAANVYDALVSPRVYRSAYTPDQAFFIMKRMAGTHINREVLKMMFEIIPAYPLGTTVIISTGRFKNYIGIVSKINEDNLSRPVIRVMFDDRRKRIEPFEIDLSTNQHINISGIIV